MLIVVPEDVNKQGLGMLDGLAGFGMEIGGGRRRTDGKRRRRDSRRGQAKDMDGQRFNCDVMKW